MKQYNEKSLRFILSCEGSVFPQAVAWALPNSILAAVLWYSIHSGSATKSEPISSLGDVTVSQVWVGYNWVIGFLVSFRVTKAYARWWEGGTLLQQARGEWFNAYSSLIAFCSDKKEKETDVLIFQQLLARLVSLLYAAALQTVAMSEDLDFDLVGFDGIDEEALMYLLLQPDKCELIIQWIQRLIVDGVNNGVLPIAPPILSRAFQELSRGVVNMHNVRKITEFQFPFPFAQTISTLLLMQWAITPIFCALQVGSPMWACVLSFVTVFATWGVNYIAIEIEQPFGADANDLPMRAMQTSMNASIVTLLQTRAQKPPKYTIPQFVTRGTLPLTHTPGEQTIAGMCATIRNRHDISTMMTSMPSTQDDNDISLKAAPMVHPSHRHTLRRASTRLHSNLMPSNNSRNTGVSSASTSSFQQVGTSTDEDEHLASTGIVIFRTATTERTKTSNSHDRQDGAPTSGQASVNSYETNPSRSFRANGAFELSLSSDTRQEIADETMVADVHRPRKSDVVGVLSPGRRGVPKDGSAGRFRGAADEGTQPNQLSSSESAQRPDGTTGEENIQSVPRLGGRFAYV